jgi:uncharacterized protein (UPF0261 family)
LVRASGEEMERVGKLMASKLNQARGPTIVMIPLRGFSYPNREGEPLYDEEGNLAYLRSLKENIAGVKVIEIDAHINDAEFANSAAQTMVKLLSDTKSSSKIF